MQRLAQSFILTLAFILIPHPLAAQEAQPSESPANFLFRDQFYASPALKIQHNTFSADDFLLVEQPAPEWNSKIAIVSAVAPQALKSRAIKDAQSVSEAEEWIRAQKKSRIFEGVPILELPLVRPDGQIEEGFWVGHKGFHSFEAAAAEVAMIKSLIEAQGGNFTEALKLAQEFAEPEEVLPSEAVKSEAQFQKEEEIALRWLDQLELGEELYGPFQGTPAGEPILYQSFGESTWRTTNLAERKFNSLVGFWTNRLVFKGIWFPINTIDPYVEMTGALESSPNDGGSQLDTVVGLEWRPLQRNAFLENFRPGEGGIPFLKWVKNYRFYAQYMDRRNMKDEILNIRDYDFRFGVDIFYEWGVEVPPVDHRPSKGFSGFLIDYVWGEYFGNYGWRDTNFTTEKNYDAFLFDTSVMLGLKTPAWTLPKNRLFEEFVLMPYLRFALIANTELSTPSDNRVFVALGLRWMPFRSYRYQNNEWLAKTKIFAEWLALGKVQNLKANEDFRPHPDEDWRIGVAFSLRRF